MVVVEVADSPEASGQFSELTSLGSLSIRLFYQAKDPLHPFWVRGVCRRGGGVQLTAHRLSIIREATRGLLFPGTLPIDALEDSIRIGP
jgi:hypothetical protein